MNPRWKRDSLSMHDVGKMFGIFFLKNKKTLYYVALKHVLYNTPENCSKLCWNCDSYCCWCLSDTGFHCTFMQSLHNDVLNSGANSPHWAASPSSPVPHCTNSFLPSSPSPLIQVEPVGTVVPSGSPIILPLPIPSFSPSQKIAFNRDIPGQCIEWDTLFLKLLSK